MGFIGLKTRIRTDHQPLCREPGGRYPITVKFFLLAAALIAFPKAVPVFGEQTSAPQSQEQASLLNYIEALRDTQLPHLTPPYPLTPLYEPSLDNIKIEVVSARADSELLKPRAELEAWQKELLRRKFEEARAKGLTRGDFAQYYALQTQLARFSAALHVAVLDAVVERARVQAHEESASIAIQAPASFFDGANRQDAEPAAVSAPPLGDANGPARYAKMRGILISQYKQRHKKGLDRFVKYVDMAIAEAERKGADPGLVLAVINQESGFNPHARSRAGARGLMQIMPGTGRGLGVRDARRLYDPRTNLRAGIDYLMSLMREFRSDVKLALAAYNAGPNAVHRAGGVPRFAETRRYVKRILQFLLVQEV